MVASWSFWRRLVAPANTSSRPRLRLPLPAADLVRMYFVLARDRLDRAVPAQRFGRYLGFELRCESASFVAIPLASSWPRIHLNILPVFSGTTSVVLQTPLNSVHQMVGQQRDEDMRVHPSVR